VNGRSTPARLPCDRRLEIFATGSPQVQQIDAAPLRCRSAFARQARASSLSSALVRPSRFAPDAVRDIRATIRDMDANACYARAGSLDQRFHTPQLELSPCHSVPPLSQP
jgi:hypothetical protein